MGEGSAKLHVAFLPYPAPGHTIPMLDMVLMMASRQVKTTVITTPLNAPNVAKHLNIVQPNNHETSNASNAPSIHVIPFPSQEKTGLPKGVQNLGLINSRQGLHKFRISMNFLKDPVEQFMEINKPDCLVADFYFPFATNLAQKFGIPRLAFNSTGFFPNCVMMGLRRYCQLSCTTVLSDNEYEPFLVPGLPHEIIMSKSQLLEDDDGDSVSQECMDVATRGYMASYGQVYNTFYELEPDYADICKKSHERVWAIGPVSLCSRRIGDHFKRGEGATISDQECFKWLDSKAPNSVIYLSFGTLTHFKDSQLMEIAIALENLGRDFIWVVRERKGEEEAWLPDGYEKRIEGGRGLIIRGWAPQALILDHQAIGAFVTHCGWNSTLEGLTAGVPMVTWPIHAEQFYNEKLISVVLKIGVQVGNKKWSSTGEGTFIDHQMLERALKQVIQGKDALEMRSNAKKLKDMAYKAVQQGGSSYCQLDSLIDHLASHSSRELNTEIDI